MYAPGFEPHVGGATFEERGVPARQVREERVLSKNAFKRLHDCVTSAIALISSVMSMPTGHHVMHRPQPTHPEVPN